MAARWLAALAVIGSAILFGGAARAQSPQDFVGDWTVEGGPLGACSINLSGQAMGGQLKATTYTCVGPMSFAWAWAPSGNGVTILGTNNFRIATLSVNRGVLTGRMNDGSLVTMKPASGQKIGVPSGNASQGGKCVHHPQSGYCAPPEDMTVPRRATNVLVLHPLAVRAEQDPKSKQIGLVEKGQCVRIDGCLDTRWGPRCLVKIEKGAIQGYINKFFTQKDTTFVGFSVGC
ncbi:protease inhibitor Inh/omp19 family protein [Pseudomonas sp. R2.Fl]|nr:protease inhibitor Inh/omp19 family protein [Pseudomonas sp. R2.Fl]